MSPKWVLLINYITDDPDSINNVVHLPPIGSSDHECLMFKLCCYTTLKISKPKESYNYYKGDYDSFNNYLKEINWSGEFEGHDINFNYNFFVQTIISSMDSYAPKTKKTHKARPAWWSKRLTTAVNHKQKLFVKWKATKATEDHQTYTQQRNKVKAMI